MKSQSTRPWYLLYCKPRQELRAQQHLANQGFNSFVPQITVQKLRANRWCSVTEPLFPRYLFLHLTPEQELNVRAIRATRGVSDFVRVGHQLAIVPQQLVLLLTEQQIMLKQQAVSNRIKKGEAVNILTGPFAGLDAVYNTADGEQRSIILINLLGQWVTANVENSQLVVKKCTNNAGEPTKR